MARQAIAVERDYCLVMHTDLLRTPRVRAVVDFLGRPDWRDARPSLIVCLLSRGVRVAAAYST